MKTYFCEEYFCQKKNRSKVIPITKNSVRITKTKMYWSPQTAEHKYMPNKILFCIY